MRLIDADDLLERFVYADVKTELVNAAHDIIEAAPTIRCADCVHFRRNGWSDEGHDIGVCYAGDVVFPDEYSAQCRADYGCSNFIAKPYGERFTAPRDDCGDCRYCADPNDKIPGCDNPVVMKP